MADNNINKWRETSRFKDLLNPTQSTSAPWAVDVAEHLKQYAQSIGLKLPQLDEQLQEDDSDSSTETEPSNSPTSVDFAQAAYIIQGSTTVYSRKVENLYSLVSSTANNLNQLKNTNGNTKQGNNNEDNDNDNDNNGGSDHDSDLFNIDDVDLMLTLDDDDDDDTNDQQQQSISENEKTEKGDDPTRLQEVPPMLKQNVNIGMTGVNLDRANYKLRTAFTHPSGALITDGCPEVDENLDIAPLRLSFQPQPQQQDEEDDISPPVDYDDDDNDNNGGDDDDSPPLISQTCESDGNALAPMVQPDATDMDVDNKNSEYLEEEEDELNPFELRDPHEESYMKRPLKVGRPFRRFPERGPKLCGFLCKRSSIAGNDESDDVSLMVDGVVGRVPRNDSLTSYVCVPAARPHVQAIVRRRRRLKADKCKGGKKLKKLKRLLDIQGEGGSDDGDEFDYDDDYDVQVTRGAGDGLPGNEQIQHLNEVLLFDNDDDNMDMFNNTGIIDNGDDDFGNGTVDMPFGGGNEFELLASNYEETCRKYVNETAKIWEDLVKDERLVERVEEWSTRIHPVLEREEQRDEFDIHACGELLIDRMKTKGRHARLNMSDFVDEKEKFQVCRLFLASLQLANDCRVEIVRDGNENAHVSNPVFTLLDVEDEGSGEGNDAVGTPSGGMKTHPKQSRITTPLRERRRPLQVRLNTNADT